MPVVINTGFESGVISDYKAKMRASGKNFVPHEGNENTDEFAHFYFVGDHGGKEVIYDAVLYTLRLQHESELFEEAEHRAANHFPGYKKISYEEDENGNLEVLDDKEEEIGLYLAEVMLELEADESIKVQEHVHVDEHTDFGVAIDIGLHVDRITTGVIGKFVSDFNSNNLQLDPTLYSFQTHVGETH